MVISKKVILEINTCCMLYGEVYIASFESFGQCCIDTGTGTERMHGGYGRYGSICGPHGPDVYLMPVLLITCFHLIGSFHHSSPRDAIDYSNLDFTQDPSSDSTHGLVAHF